MSKANAAHVVAINKLMLDTIADYIKCFVTADADTTDVTMYADDVAHNSAALCVFNGTRDYSVLHKNIMLQDTLVREYFIETLQYLENNKLVPADMFACR